MLKIIIASACLILFGILGILIWKRKMFFLLAGYTPEVKSKIINVEKFARFNGMMIIFMGIWCFIWLLFLMEKSYSSILFIIILIFTILFQVIFTNFFLIDRKK
ncbi:DUF3784 domain-containing protein [Bacillus paranthracis]|uniref:DUF3784 domain-containing protein n=1 Tax=Bacillus paranthracis TaxID=2026186 RepID=UPI0002DB2CE0|nr:DUF3784 domain-containing protein [Bacillus paranthracis]MED1613604.1 DUF3784 domain-containing protein [Bacillus paranthracis]MED1684882.1 DUF3784 domain-containing protein [Bacillus paranthracis]ONG86500.1 hypothetical protein BKK40_26325 [Bacillus cereus]